MTARIHFTRPSVSLSLPEAVAAQNAPECVLMAKRARDTCAPGQWKKMDQMYRLVVARHLNG